MQCFIFFVCLTCVSSLFSKTLKVGKNEFYKTIQLALDETENNDTILVYAGTYKENNLVINHSVFLIGIDGPVIDGQKKYEVVSVKANRVWLEGFRIINSGFATLDDPCGIKVYGGKNVTIQNNVLENNFFGIYLQNCINCTIKNNKVGSNATEEQQIGNGIHCWKSDSLKIINNRITGHRDGVYFEFVTNSVIWRNISIRNIRYGLHFMFSNDDAYIGNTFRENGAGVAVMYTKRVKMFNNIFENNWGDASYGLLLKDITDSYLYGNKFISNTTGILMEGTSRIEINKNIFQANGWGMKISASCMDIILTTNNFIANTFDLATNGTLVLNNFNGNYWDKYEGYDLNKDQIGDVPYHPLSLFSVIVESMPSAMLLFRSFMITLLDKSEKLIPSLTPDNFRDEKPLMKALTL